MAVNVNRVVLTGNLTADPELHTTQDRPSRCRLRVAVNGRKRVGDTWQDRPNFLDVTVFGGQAETCARFLHKGRAIAVDGRLEWSEWTDEQERRHQAVGIVAEAVQFLGAPRTEGSSSEAQTADRPDTPAAEPADAEPATASPEIPF